jgi:hypothetical protein
MPKGKGSQTSEKSLGTNERPRDRPARRHGCACIRGYRAARPLSGLERSRASTLSPSCLERGRERDRAATRIGGGGRRTSPFTLLDPGQSSTDLGWRLPANWEPARFWRRDRTASGQSGGARRRGGASRQKRGEGQGEGPPREGERPLEGQGEGKGQRPLQVAGPGRCTFGPAWSEVP